MPRSFVTPPALQWAAPLIVLVGIVAIVASVIFRYDLVAAKEPAPATQDEEVPTAPPSASWTSGDAYEARPPADEPAYHSPIHVCVSRDGRRAWVVNQAAASVSVLDLEERTVLAEIPVGARPTQAVVTPDERRLYVTCAYDYTVDEVDLEEGRVVRSLPVGYEPYGLVLSADGRRLSVVNSLANTVSILSTETGESRFEIPVGRLPRYVAETPDGERLIVANGHSRDVSIIDPEIGRVVETRSLDRGAQMRNVICTADGRWAITTTLVGHDEMITTQMDRGWINSNGFSVLDLSEHGHYVTLLLDRLLTGATNPWGAAISADGGRLYVSLAGIHQVAIVDLPAALRLVEETTPEEVQRLSQDVEILEQRKIAQRVDAGGIGPRSVAVNDAKNELLVANYFSDTVTVLDAETGAVKATIPLGPEQEMTLWREGEMRFNDGRICFENWYSCSSCHQENGTMDSLNWDLINDGMGNPKNAKSMHNGIFEAPAMWSGVRADQNVGTMAGQRFLGFLPDDDVQAALMEFIGKPRRAPNPYRDVDPDLLERGERVFYRARCDVCHAPPTFSDRKMHDVGLTGYTSRVDFRVRFDTPSLIECYRTGPYLHDGRAETLREIFTEHNPTNAHGLTRGLSDVELDELVAFLRSL